MPIFSSVLNPRMSMALWGSESRVITTCYINLKSPDPTRTCETWRHFFNRMFLFSGNFCFIICPLNIRKCSHWSSGFFTLCHISLSTHVCGHQLLRVVDAQHGEFSLADERVVVRVGGYQQHLWNKTSISLRIKTLKSRYQIQTSSKFIYRLTPASCSTWSDRRCGSFSLPAAETSLWIFPKGLNI